MVEPFDVAQILLINDIGPRALFFGLSLIGGLLPQNVSVRYDYQELKKFCWVFLGFASFSEAWEQVSMNRAELWFFWALLWLLLCLNPLNDRLVWHGFVWNGAQSVPSGLRARFQASGSRASVRHCWRGCCNRTAMWICRDGWSTLVVFGSTWARCNDHPCWSSGWISWSLLLVNNVLVVSYDILALSNSALFLSPDPVD